MWYFPERRRHTVCHVGAGGASEASLGVVDISEDSCAFLLAVLQDSPLLYDSLFLMCDAGFCLLACLMFNEPAVFRLWSWFSNFDKVFFPFLCNSDSCVLLCSLGTLLLCLFIHLLTQHVSIQGPPGAKHHARRWSFSGERVFFMKLALWQGLSEAHTEEVQLWLRQAAGKEGSGAM